MELAPHWFSHFLGKLKYSRGKGQVICAAATTGGRSLTACCPPPRTAGRPGSPHARTPGLAPNREVRFSTLGGNSCRNPNAAESDPPSRSGLEFLFAPAPFTTFHPPVIP